MLRAERSRRERLCESFLVAVSGDVCRGSNVDRDPCKIGALLAMGAFPAQNCEALVRYPCVWVLLGDA